ncbi:fungal-specific transcription factor domain-containing protein [Fennellomyces sp. T-0311]|nr:fungal-specific transcription factor domain-containing protein [Fennellomyces sp. T-0311]
MDADPHDDPPRSAKPRSNRNQRRSSNAEKRNKANKACKGCRKKKVKCEGEVPCERCQKAGLECVFDTIPPAKRTSNRRSAAASQQPVRTPSQDEADAKEALGQTQEEGFTAVPAPADGISVSTTGRGLYIPDWLSRGGADQGSPDGDRNSVFAKASDIHTDLLGIYFEHVHPYLPIIHRPTFQKQLQDKKICELLLYAMYAVASRWQPQPKQQQQDPSGWSYYETAFKLLDNYADAPRLSTVQALILMIKYHEHVRRPGFFWRTRFYFQLIVRMCQDLELYRHRSGDQPRAADTEQRSRVFWAVYAYDVLTSTEQGTLANFTNCSVEFPQLLKEEDGTERDVITYFHWTAKISHLHGKILSFLRLKYGQNADDPSDDATHVRPLTATQEQKQRDALVSSIDELGKAMSAAIRQPPSTDDKSSAKQYPYYASRFLYMAFHFTAILLHRPYGEASASHREQCFNAALVITQIAGELIQTGGVECLYYCPRGVQQVIHYLAASITIHRLLTQTTATTKRDASPEKKAKEACDKSLDIIHQLIKVSPAVEIYANHREPTPPSPSPTPMEEVPISPQDRTVKARRVSKEFSGVRQNSIPVPSKASSNMAMPPPPQPQQQQNTPAMNTPVVNTMLQQQALAYSQPHHHHHHHHHQHQHAPNRLSAPMMMDYTSSLYLQQQPHATQYPVQQPQQPQFGLPFSQASGGRYYPQAVQQQQPFITQTNHHAQNMYHQQHLQQHQHHQQQQQQQHHPHPSSRRHTVSGDMTTINNFMAYPVTTAPSNPWPMYADQQDIQSDQYIQTSVAQSMMGLLMDQDENSMFAATAAAPAPP